MSLIKKLAGETVIYGGSTILNRLLNYIIVTPYLTRIFDDERKWEYGIHGLLYGYSAVLLVVLTYGMETAFFRFSGKGNDKEATFSTATFSLLGSTLVFVLLTVLFARPLAGLVTRPQDASFIVLFAFIIGFDVLSAVPFAKLRQEGRPYRFALLKAANVVVNGLLLIFFLEGLPLLVRSGVGWAGEVYAPGRELLLVFSANLLASAFTLLLFLPEYLRMRLVFDRELWQRMIAYALPLVIVGVAGIFNQVGDRLMLDYLLPRSLSEQERLDQVGVYAACTKIAVLMSLFTQAFRYASEPFFFRYADESDSRVVYARVGQAFALVGSLGFLGIMLYLDLFRYLVDRSYWSQLDIVPILLLAYLFLGLYYNLSVWYKLTDMTRMGAIVSLAGLAVLIGTSFILIPRIGYLGAAWATFACFGFTLVLSYVLGQKYYPVPYPVGRISAYILLAAGVYWVSEYLAGWLGEENLVYSIGINTILLLAYAGALVAMEYRQIRQLIKRTVQHP